MSTASGSSQQTVSRSGWARATRPSRTSRSCSTTTTPTSRSRTSPVSEWRDRKRATAMEHGREFERETADVLNAELVPGSGNQWFAKLDLEEAGKILLS